MTTLLTLAALGAAALACGCGGEDDATTTARRAILTVPTTTTPPPPAAPITSASDLDGRTFVSTAVVGHELVPGSRIALTFQDGLLSAKAGCNTLVAPFGVVEQTLRTTGSAAGTMMGCDPKLQQQDEWLSDVLEKGVGASLVDDTLTLRGRTVGLELVDEGKPAGGKRPPVVGTAWVLAQVVDREGRTTKVSAGTRPPTIHFDDDGSVRVHTGCNPAGGHAEVGKDGLIVFGDIGIGAIRCTGAKAQLEDVITRVLDGKAAYAFEGDDLVIAKNGTHLVYQAEP